MRFLFVAASSAEERLSPICAAAREGAEPYGFLARGERGRRRHRRRCARRQECGLPFLRASMSPHRDPRRLEAPHLVRQSAQDSGPGEDEDRVYVVCADPFDTAGTRRRPRAFRQARRGARRRAPRSRSTPSTASTSATTGGGELESDEEQSTKTSSKTSSTPTTRRRSSAGSTRSSSRR